MFTLYDLYTLYKVYTLPGLQPGLVQGEFEVRNERILLESFSNIIHQENQWAYGAADSHSAALYFLLSE